MKQRGIKKKQKRKMIFFLNLEQFIGIRESHVKTKLNIREKRKDKTI